MKPKQQCASFVREELIDARWSNSLVVWEVRNLHNSIISCYARILLKRSTPKLIHVYVIPRPNGSHKRTFPLPFFLHKFAFFSALLSALITPEKKTTNRPVIITQIRRFETRERQRGKKSFFFSRAQFRFGFSLADETLAQWAERERFFFLRQNFPKTQIIMHRLKIIIWGKWA